MAERVKVVFPVNYPGYAFEVFSLLVLQKFFGFNILEKQFNIRLPSGKWVQFDGLLEKDERRFILEARFTKVPIRASDIQLRLSQAKMCGYDGLVVTLRSGVDKITSQLNNVISITLDDMLNSISKRESLVKHNQMFNTRLDKVVFDKNHIKTEKAIIEVDALTIYWKEPLLESDIIRVIYQYEIWIRRIGALTGRFEIEYATVPVIKSIDGSFEGGLDYLWYLEDIMSGMANLNISAMIETGNILSKGCLSFSDVMVGLRYAGFRAGDSGIKDILKMLTKLGIVEMKEKKYYLTCEGRQIFKGGQNIDLLKNKIANWAPIQFISSIVDGIGSDIHNVIEEMERIYNGVFPYARNTFNENRTKMLINMFEFSRWIATD